MKKIFLTAIALLTMASAQVFGMYGAGSGWIDFLVHGNQFRSRMNQLGFVLGNDTIKGTFGFVNGENSYGQLLNSDGGLYYDFKPTISMGLGYTSSLISVGVGYNATISTNRWTKSNGKKTEVVAHTPVLTLTALDNAFRMAIPIQVVHLADKVDGIKANITAVSMEAQFRYYPGLDALSRITLYLKYGNYSYQAKGEGLNEKGKMAESFGFDFRLHFGSVVIEEVSLQPIVKIQYNTALGKQHKYTGITAVGVLNDAANKANNPNFEAPLTYGTSGYGTSAWNLNIIPSFGLSAGSDVVSLYLEPNLGLKITQSGHATQKVKEVYDLYYGAYGEVYINPVKNLSWYLGVDVNNGGSYPINFDAATGVTWYLPAL